MKYRLLKINCYLDLTLSKKKNPVVASLAAGMWEAGR